MKAVLQVTTLEVWRRILLFPAALVFGFMPFVLNPLLRTPAAMEHLIGVAGALVLVMVVGAILGASAVGSDLQAGRLSFFFSRPLSGWSIFAGKLLAAVLLTLVASFLTALPVLVSEAARAQQAFVNRPEKAPLLLGVTLLVILGAHFMGVVVRARSPLVFLDVVLLTVSIPVLDRGVASLGGFEALALRDPHLRGLTCLTWFLVAVLFASGLVQTVVGRTDLARSHRAASFTFWPLFLVLPAGLAFYVSWLNGSTSADLTEVWRAAASRDGRYLDLDGPARGGRPAAFVFDTRTGTEVRRGEGRVFLARDVAFSEDGSHAAWLAATEDLKVELRTFAPGGAMEAPQTTVLQPWPAPWWRTEFRMLPGNEHVLLREPHLSVYDVRSGARTLFVPDAPGQPFLAARPVSGSRVRAYRRSAAGLEVLEAPLSGGPAEVVGRLDLPSSPRGGPAPRLRFDSGDARMLVLRDDPASILVADARSGQVVREIAVESGPLDAVFLGEGRIVVADAAAGVRVLRGPDLAPEASIAFEAAPGFVPRALTLRPAGAGRLLASVESFPGVLGRLHVVDLRAGRLVRTEAGVSLLSGEGGPGDETVVLWAEGPSFVRYDVAAGTRTVLWSKGRPASSR